MSKNNIRFTMILAAIISLFFLAMRKYDTDAAKEAPSKTVVQKVENFKTCTSDVPPSEDAQEAIELQLGTEGEKFSTFEFNLFANRTDGEFEVSLFVANTRINTWGSTKGTLSVQGKVISDVGPIEAPVRVSVYVTSASGSFNCGGNALMTLKVSGLIE